MKISIIFTVIIGLYSALLVKADPQQFIQYIIECKTSTGATDGDVTAILSRQIPLPSDTANCLMACVFKNMGVLNADNTMNTENVKKMFNKMQQRDADLYQEVIDIFVGCKPASGLSECAAGKAVYNCTEPKMQELLPSRRSH